MRLTELIVSLDGLGQLKRLFTPTSPLSVEALLLAEIGPRLPGEGIFRVKVSRPNRATLLRIERLAEAGDLAARLELMRTEKGEVKMRNLELELGDRSDEVEAKKALASVASYEAMRLPADEWTEVLLTA